MRFVANARGREAKREFGNAKPWHTEQRVPHALLAGFGFSISGDRFDDEGHSEPILYEALLRYCVLSDSDTMRPLGSCIVRRRL